MPVTETHRALGAWSLTLSPDTPKAVLDSLEYLGHVTVHVGRVDPRTAGDGLLASSRYTGVLRGLETADEGHTLSGAGMAFWLGDEDGKGSVYETAISFTAETFTQTIRDLLPASGSVTEGTFHAITGTYTGTHQYQDPRTAIDYVCDTMVGEWRVNGDATLDVGAEEDLFVTVPAAAIVRRAAGVDMRLRAFSGQAGVTVDVEDFSTRVVLLAENEGGAIATGSADISPGLNVYKDLHGNPVALTRLASESETSSTNADIRAQLLLNRFTSTRDALRLSTTDYDIKGTAAPGDYVWVHDPDIGLFDDDNEVTFRGARIYPVKLRLRELSWPVVEGSSVSYRDGDGNWSDLTPYVVWETDSTSIVVGGYNRSLTGSGTEAPSSRPKPDTSVPDVTVWVEPFRLGVYQSTVTGEARGDAILEWLRPDNTDATPIIDGSHFEIRYRRATVPAYPVTYDDVTAAGLTYDDITTAGGTWDHPITFPETEWQFAVAPFDATTFRLQELVPAMSYEAQIRAVDLATPSNVGAWSALAVLQTTRDNIPPVTPAPPTIASNPLAVQMVHRLGAATGGEFNLDRDLHHLELHGGTEPLFAPGDDTLLGKVIANWGMVVGMIPVVETFQITSLLPVYFRVVAVDESGNKSLPSAAIQATAGLIDDQYISNLTVSKVTAGSITADWLMAGRLATMPVGGYPGVEQDSNGLRGWSTSGQKMLEWQSSTGKLIVNGSGGIEINDGRLVVKNAAGHVIVELGECADGRHGLQVYKDNGTRVTRVGELESGSEGIETIGDTGQLVRIDTLAFGTKAATASAIVSTTSNSFVYLSGPDVTVTLGNSGRMLVILTASILPNTVGGAGFVGYEVWGPAGVISVGDQLKALWLLGDGGSSAGVAAMAASKVFLVEGLAQGPGNYTIKPVYKSATAGASVQFFDRHVVAIPF